MFSLKEYDFELPQELIAQTPVYPRDHSRLLVVDRVSGKIYHKNFLDLPGLLPSQAVLVANNSKVIRARLLGHRVLSSSGVLSGKVEVFLLQKLRDTTWECLVKSSASVKQGFQFKVNAPQDKKTLPPLMGEVIQGYSDSKNGTVKISFNQEPSHFGEIPLPPYIKKNDLTKDQTDYQTMYAKQEGSVAAPTAGLHFTARIFEKLKEKKISWEEVTLHVGLGTFRPVKTEDIRSHQMHEEFYCMPAEVKKRLEEFRLQKKPIGAVGTTALRVLESAWREEKESFQEGEGRTHLFLYPGGEKKIHVVDFLLTNFHLPQSTLFLLVCFIAGENLMKKAYAEAIQEKYRFFSYGDAMLIL